VLLPCSSDPPDLPSFPTRRSSDLYRPEPCSSALHACRVHRCGRLIRTRAGFGGGAQGFGGRPEGRRAKPPGGFRKTRPSQNTGRSEEHTSELQSRFELVCRLLLEK